MTQQYRLLLEGIDAMPDAAGGDAVTEPLNRKG
jgi:hypothetical protein